MTYRSMGTVKPARTMVELACLSFRGPMHLLSAGLICPHREPQELLHSPRLNQASADSVTSARLTLAPKMAALTILRAASICRRCATRALLEAQTLLEARTLLVGLTFRPFAAGRPECLRHWEGDREG